MISNDTFAACFGSVPAGDTESLVRVAVHAVRNGYAIVPNRPGQKVPVCTLTARQAKQADTAAQQEAKAAGDVYWQRRRHPCGLHHAITEDTVARRVIARLLESAGPINLGIEVGRSRMVVVDVDTPEERDAFLAHWSQAAGGANLADQPPTVLSPGSMTVAADGTETWAHHGGGHFWFTLPEGVELPETLGVLKDPAGWAVMWRDKQVLVPPSVRAEGPYRLAGQPLTAPGWLIQYIYDGEAEHATRRTRAVRSMQDSDSPIDRWAAEATWADLLLPDGWIDTGLADSCGCPVWTAPGDHSSPKSATAHDLGCDRYDTLGGHAPLHVWTDNPPEWVHAAVRAKGSNTLTKLTYLAYRFYDGNDGAALRGMGITEPKDTEFGGFDPSTFEYSANGEADHFAYERKTGDSAAEKTMDKEDIKTADDIADDIVSDFLSKFLTLDQMDDLPELEPLISGILDMDTINRVTGKSNHGKTFAMIDISCHIATGMGWNGREVRQGDVAYIAAEGALGFRKRARAWEKHHGKSVGPGLRILPQPVQATDAVSWHLLVSALEQLKPRLVVLDTQARMTVGADENSARDMGILVERVEQIRRHTGACVILVHHLGHQGEHARGSTAVVGAVSTEIRVVREDSGEIVLSCAKQKDHEEFEPITARLEVLDDSAVLVTEDAHDPFTAPAPPEDEPMWRRMLSTMQDSAPHVGLSRAQTISLVRDRYNVPRSRRSYVYRAWDRLVTEGLVHEIAHPDTGKGTGQWLPAARNGDSP